MSSRNMYVIHHYLWVDTFLGTTEFLLQFENGNFPSSPFRDVMVGGQEIGGINENVFWKVIALVKERICKSKEAPAILLKPISGVGEGRSKDVVGGMTKMGKGLG